MKILVCISSVPDTTSKISFTDDNTAFNQAGIQYIIGPYDDYALARGVELKEANGGTVTVLNIFVVICRVDADTRIHPARGIPIIKT